MHVKDIETNVIEGLAEKDHAPVAFAAANIERLIGVILAIGFAAHLDVEIKCRGRLNGQTVLLIRDIPASPPNKEEIH